MSESLAREAKQALDRIRTAIRESHEFSDDLLEGAPGCVVIVGSFGTILQANSQACGLLGLEPEALAGRNISDFAGDTIWEDGTPCAPGDYPVAKCLKTGAPQPTVTIGVRIPSGGTHWATYGATPLRCPSSGDLLGAVVTFLDVTERKHTEEALRRSEARLRTLLATSPDHILTIDENGKILYLNRLAPELEGQDVIGTSCYDYFPEELHPLLREALRAAIEEGRSTSFETSTHHGRTYTTRVAAVEVRDGERSMAMLVATDITETRTAESDHKRLQARIQEAQRMESLALLAGGIAHDFNNLLVGVVGYIELALRKIESGHYLHDHLQGAHTAAMRATDLTSQLLAYSGKGKFLVQPLDLNALVREMAQLMEVSLSKKLKLRLDLLDRLEGVEADATQMRQVIMNLIANAAEAMEEKPTGTVVVRTRPATAAEVAAARYAPESHEDQTFVALEVSDQGCGMSEPTLEKIFDPFFTTKFTGRGLGLAAALGIVRGHGAGLDVESTTGSGSTFRILLPSMGYPVAPLADAPTPSPEEARKRTGTVLVVDDEEHVRFISEVLLEESGYDVLTACDGAEAVEAFRERSDEINVVLLDLLMPNMDGEEALAELRKIRPDVRVILTSGYGEEVATDHFADGELAGFLKKPFRLDDMLSAVRIALRR